MDNSIDDCKPLQQEVIVASHVAYGSISFNCFVKNRNEKWFNFKLDSQSCIKYWSNQHITCVLQDSLITLWIEFYIGRSD